MVSLSNGIDSWALMALIFKDLDDYDYKNALLLSERLFAIDNDCDDFRLLYAKCHYMLKDYNAANDLLKKTTMIPCRHLFARTCLELGNLTNKSAEKISYWRTGIQSLQKALSDYAKLETGQNWADDLTCVSTRSHMPSEASIHNLLGELYHQIDNMHGSAQQLLQCLAKNPFKLTAYINLCEIAPDAGLSDSSILPSNTFKAFHSETTPLKRSSNCNLPLVPSKIPPSTHRPRHTTLTTPATTSQQKLSPKSLWASALASTSDTPVPSTPVPSTPVPSTAAPSTAAPSAAQQDKRPPVDYLMPMIRSSYSHIPLLQFRAVVEDYIHKHPEIPSMKNDEPERNAIEKTKDKILETMADDIKKQRVEQARKNKHGLHKKPTTELAHELAMDPMDTNDEEMDSDNDIGELRLASPPRVDSSSTSDIYQNYEAPGVRSTIINQMRNKRSSGQLTDPTKQPLIAPRFKPAQNASQQFSTSIDSYFIPWLSNAPTHSPDSQDSLPNASKRPYLGKTTTGTTTTELAAKATKDALDQTILDTMNRIVWTLFIIAKAHYSQSHYYCRDTALVLQKLDDAQYDTPSVLCLMGRAYYDASDHEFARVFYRRSFSIAPWYCEGIPLYSTCLWYLDKEQELCLLAKVMKENQAHQYEAYIAAGNWAKCGHRSNETVQWFQKAVGLDPSRSYGHGLLGYEELEKNNYLGARQHFQECMNTNKQSYLGWYGSAKAYQSMNYYPQARTFIKEAIRLHPRHPLLLGTMAEILWSMKEYELAHQFSEKSLAISDSDTMQELRKKIKRQLDLRGTETSH